MRIESSVTSVSWIPSEAIEGLPKLPFELGIGHHDRPPPDRLAPGDPERLCEANLVREINRLKAWIEVRDGRTVDYGHAGAAAFPRHWIYDHEGRLVHKAGTVDFTTWYKLGPGVIVGERAVLEAGRRTASCGPAPPCRAAVFPAHLIDRAALKNSPPATDAKADSHSYDFGGERD